MKVYDLLKLDSIYTKLKEQKIDLDLSFFKSIEVAAQAPKNELFALAALYGEKNEEGEVITDENGDIKFSSNTYTEFEKSLMEIMDKEIEIEVPKIKLSIEELETFDLTFDEFDFLFSYIMK